ncbi:NAD-dependent succinate-semialdehyde dehydrogenase [Aestuariirhabdus sp. Z084]|uniref:NAD-dependent succinate-semialdehyde dehydrogenase n=1 Tax=Aestuariirhabdus haliotis TaxID=2918751 RepID=UPI00201B35DA|nr:NAD-dependent succinate-semialdehyde dehydrogenase [Aestuariirhabdus haliotis]MCL6415403.1 NAD-dependent succinate-semialdehyde dehydrogenase [Aestuariirhabdus haliotis]MCL6419159.1 NAD-dependent succinate-semialdehyde dehydrogenase [Aestuariirhabdus haliotis]
MLALNDTDLLRTQAYINGEWVSAGNNTEFTVLNPANGETLASVADLGALETRQAIEAAYQAGIEWRQTTAKYRAGLLKRWFELIMQHQEDLARIMTAEQGKPLLESRGEVAYGASFVEWFAEEAKRVYGETIPTPSNDKRILTIRQPIGVVAAITPWNFPNAMITRKVAPALAAGCTAVVKPGEDTPLSALALAELAERAGIPKGVFNVVTSNDAPAVGTELSTHPRVRKLSFTGSTRVGKLLMSQCAGTVKKVALELGGNAPFIVFDDADLEAAVAGAMASKFRNAGQTCVCANRFLVQRGIYDQFSRRLTEAVTQLQTGNGFEAGVTTGPLINSQALNKVDQLVQGARQQGAKVVCGGKPDALGGNYYQPTVLTDVSQQMDISSEEIFGPVATLIPFDTEEEAIAVANDTPYGLAAYFYSRDIGRVWRVSEGLEYGIVGANEGIISSEVAPFGGVKESGIGREGSRYGIDDFVEIKYLCMGGI